MKERNKNNPLGKRWRKIIASKLILIFLISLISFSYEVSGQTPQSSPAPAPVVTPVPSPALPTTRPAGPIYLNMNDGCEFTSKRPEGDIKSLSGLFNKNMETKISIDTLNLEITNPDIIITETGRNKLYVLNNFDPAGMNDKQIDIVKKLCKIDDTKAKQLFGTNSALGKDSFFVQEANFQGSNIKFDNRGTLTDIKNIKLNKDLDGSFFGLDKKIPFKVGKDSIINSFDGSNLKLGSGSPVYFGGNAPVKVDDFVASLSKDGKSIDQMSFVPKDSSFDFFGNRVSLDGQSKFLIKEFDESGKPKSIFIGNNQQDKPLNIKEFGKLKNINVKSGSFGATFDDKGNTMLGTGDKSEVLFQDAFSKDVNVKLNQLDLDKLEKNWYQDKDGFLHFGDGERTILVGKDQILTKATDPRTIFLGQDQKPVSKDVPSIQFDKDGKLIPNDNVKDMVFYKETPDKPYFKISKGKFDPQPGVSQDGNPIKSVIVNGKEFYYQSDKGWLNKPATVNVGERLVRPALGKRIPQKPTAPGTSGKSGGTGGETNPLTTLLLIGGLAAAIGLVLAYNNKDKGSSKDKNKGNTQTTGNAQRTTGSYYG